MHDPFHITGPAVISFSGGRTSGYMLHRILESHNGVLPSDVKVVFCNTGKERLETLDFVERCSQEWAVPIVWLEYRRDESKPIAHKGKNNQPSIGRHSWTIVDYGSASRAGRPFNELLQTMAEFRREAKGKDPVLPNPVQRFCTGEMKVRTMFRYLTNEGWNLDNTLCAIGIRHDEPKRVKKIESQTASQWECGEPDMPLNEAGITEPIVMEFWSKQSFDLGLKQHEGNCDLCFLKNKGKIQTILRSRPDLSDWWIEAEKQSGQTFRNDRATYELMLRDSRNPQIPGMEHLEDDLSIACHCTD